MIAFVLLETLATILLLATFIYVCVVALNRV